MGETSALSRNSRLFSVDVLRAIAALAVLFGHIGHDAPGGWREHYFTLFSFLLDYGTLGVPLFIVISGFCIHLRTAQRKARGGPIDTDWASFWWRRFRRLYPPYVAAIVFALGCAALYGGKVVTSEIDLLPWDLGTHLLMVHNLTPQYVVRLGNGPFWSLGLEEQLYLLYFAVVTMRGRFSAWKTLLVVGVISVGWNAALWTFPEFQLGGLPITLGHYESWPFSLWFTWVLGAIAAEAHAGVITLPTWCRWRWLPGALMSVGFLTSYTLFHWLGALSSTRPFVAALEYHGGPGLMRCIWLTSLMAFSLAFFLVIHQWTQREQAGAFRGRLVSLFAWIGTISYSLYLTHRPLLDVVDYYLDIGYYEPAWIFRFLVYPPMCVGFAALFYWGVERWFLNKSRPPRPATTTPAHANGTGVVA